jgi:hypothetical protein
MVTSFQIVQILTCLKICEFWKLENQISKKKNARPPIELIQNCPVNFNRNVVVLTETRMTKKEMKGGKTLF